MKIRSTTNLVDKSSHIQPLYMPVAFDAVDLKFNSEIIFFNNHDESNYRKIFKGIRESARNHAFL